MKKSLVFIALLTVACSPIHSRAQSGVGEVDVAQVYDCVYKSFALQNGQAATVDPSAQLDSDGIAQLILRVNGPLRSALVDATNRTYARLGRKNPKQVQPAEFYGQFVDQLVEVLPHYFKLDQCEPNEESKHTARTSIYDVAINRFFADLMGASGIRSWFKDNGGFYDSSSFLAAVIGLKIAGYDSDVDAWKRYYPKYVQSKSHR